MLGWHQQTGQTGLLRVGKSALGLLLGHKWQLGKGPILEGLPSLPQKGIKNMAPLWDPVRRISIDGAMLWFTEFFKVSKNPGSIGWSAMDDSDKQVEHQKFREINDTLIESLLSSTDFYLEVLIYQDKELHSHTYFEMIQIHDHRCLATWQIHAYILILTHPHPQIRLHISIYIYAYTYIHIYIYIYSTYRYYYIYIYVYKVLQCVYIYTSLFLIPQVFQKDLSRVFKKSGVFNAQRSSVSYPIAHTPSVSNISRSSVGLSGPQCTLAKRCLGLKRLQDTKEVPRCARYSRWRKRATEKAGKKREKISIR